MPADPVVALLPVTQADREAAAGWIGGSPYDVVKAEAEMIRIGQLNNHRLVQAFARHRTPTPASGDVVERVAEALALHRYPGGHSEYDRPTRWPVGPDDKLDDRDGKVPFAWEFAELCRAEARVMLAAASPTPDSSADGDVLARHVAEVMEEDGGCWTACSGCQESDEGYVSEKYYPYSPIFKCQPGGGCRECGGIGVIWQDGAFLASYGNALMRTTPDNSAVSGSAEGLRDGWQPIETAVMWEVYVVTNGENVALAQYAESDHGDAYWSIDPEDCLEWEPTHCIAPPAALTEGQQS